MMLPVNPPIPVRYWKWADAPDNFGLLIGLLINPETGRVAKAYINPDDDGRIQTVEAAHYDTYVEGRDVL